MRHLVLFAFLGCGGTDPASFPDGGTLEGQHSAERRVRKRHVEPDGWRRGARAAYNLLPVTLRHERAKGETFDPRFFEKDDRFWPIVDAARRFADRTDWPDPEEHVADGVRFVTAKKQKTLNPDEMYDGQIVRGIVPTRPRCWHDFLNALVWATFPKAKMALHKRQHDLVRAWIPPGATVLPNARTREHDAVALIDEGGMLVLGDFPIPFGHALFEGLVHRVPAMIARTVPFQTDERSIEAADRLLADFIRTPIVPEQLPRFPFSDYRFRRSDRKHP